MPPEITGHFSWVPVLVDGAHRGNLNESVVSMCVFKDALYIGTGIQNGGHDLTYDVGPAAAEVVRVHPDDSWGSVTGTARHTPDGYRAPLSGLGPGFDNFFNGYIWRMEAHAGRLRGDLRLEHLSCRLPSVAGVSRGLSRRRPSCRPSWIGSAQSARPSQMAERLLRWFDADNLVKFEGGFDLWSTGDGVTWLPVTTTGFGNPYFHGLPPWRQRRTACSWGPRIPSLGRWRPELWMVGLRAEPGRGCGGSGSPETGEQRASTLLERK